MGQNLRQNLEQNLGKENLYEPTLFWGQQDSYWIAFYLFPEKFLGVNYGEYSEKLNWFAEIAKSCNWIWVFKNICFISDRPKVIYKKGFRLHHESSPAIEYRDGYGIYCLNGVNVPKEIVKTPAEKLDQKLLITEKNAEVRREILRKIGVGRALQKLNAKKLDEWREYELYKIDDIDIESVNILKMKCPSHGVMYTLRVPPEIEKAREAIKWCNHGIDAEEIEVAT